jgi:hypothetical protein
MQPNNIKWPHGKKFAFTVFDDTDHATMQNVPELYRFLSELGFATTKSVWPLKGNSIPDVGGITCEDSDYLKWAQELQRSGFEIALHNVTYHSSTRDQILHGLGQFKQFFGSYPNIHVNHVGCDDSVYWGASRLSGINRFIYNVLTRYRNQNRFQGNVESSPFFWGDILKEHIKYARNFVYSDMNTLKVCPYLPYYDKTRPYVNNWFASSEGANCQSFCHTISEQNQDRLEEEGGACIMYTHFGAPDFYQNGQLNPRFKSLMERLSNKGGWFVPVSTLLDYIQAQRGGQHIITTNERNQLERKWLMEKIFVTRGTS